YQPSEESIKEFEKHLKTVVISALEGVIQPPQEMSIQDKEDLRQSFEINKKKKLQKLDQVANLSTYPSQHFNSFCYDDDDDEEATIQVREYYMNSHVSITPDFLITNSVIMEDEHLDTILETELDELIKSSVENLVSIPSESEDFSDIESECDVPVCDDFTTSSNPLYDSDGDSTSSDDESFFDENVLKEVYSNPLFDEEVISIKIDPHHFNVESNLTESLLNQNSSIISSHKFDSLLEEFSSELAHIDLISLEIDKADFNPEE
nr:hypothetical protein [Tanacetum cinerariifolium]